MELSEEQVVRLNHHFRELARGVGGGMRLQEADQEDMTTAAWVTYLRTGGVMKYANLEIRQEAAYLKYHQRSHNAKGAWKPPRMRMYSLEQLQEAYGDYWWRALGR